MVIFHHGNAQTRNKDETKCKMKPIDEAAFWSVDSFAEVFCSFNIYEIVKCQTFGGPEATDH